ncbi:MAG: FGGY family carbohydrate kinase, partial [Firmicutes bacterium]|nr:FGGY family carbohydrate kinase [Bacillota bacterium]
MSLLLGIDLGTSAVKVLAVSSDGEILGIGSAGYVLQTPHPGWVEQDPAEWWQAVRSAVRQCLAALPAGRSVDAIGFSGHMSGLVLVDEAGRPVRPCIMLTDTRSEEQSARLRRSVGERVRAITGNFPLDAFVAPKLLWVKEREPEVHRRARTFLFPKDYIRFLLTGDLRTEPADAGNTLFLNPRTGAWDRDLCRGLGLDPELAPPVAQSAEVVGRVTAEAAAACGLPAGVPVVAGGGDMACSAVGIGAVEPGVVAVTIGTAAQVLACVPDLSDAVGGQLTFHPHAEPGTLFALGSIFSGGLATRWLARAFGEEERLNQDAPAYFAELSDQAAAAPPGSGGVIFLPFLVGSGSPFWNPH